MGNNCLMGIGFFFFFLEWGDEIVSVGGNVYLLAEIVLLLLITTNGEYKE